MKAEFPGYYKPSEDDVNRAWKEGTVILDANVLLDLYKLPKLARDELLEILMGIRGRLWVPHQVALEFQRSRLRVIDAESKVIDEYIEKAGKAFRIVTASINDLSLPRRGINADIDGLVGRINAIDEEVAQLLSKARSPHPELGTQDGIRTAIDLILEGRVGPGSHTQEELDALCKDGTRRYEQRRPPGFEDLKTGVFVHNGIVYENKFGDLILWRQIIDHVTKNSSHVILVTQEKKSDWWSKNGLGELTPHPELVAEIRSVGKVDVFLMYNISDFMRLAKKYLQSTVAEMSITEAKAVEVDESTVIDVFPLDASSFLTSFFRHHEDVKAPIAQWLISEDLGKVNEAPLGIPTWIVNEGIFDTWYHLLDARKQRLPTTLKKELSDLARRYIATKDAGALHFIVLCRNRDDARRVMTHYGSQLTQADSILFGTVEGGVFKPTDIR